MLGIIIKAGTLKSEVIMNQESLLDHILPQSFNDLELKVLHKLHYQLVENGGPIDFHRFGQLYSILSNNVEPPHPATVQILFTSCDHDKDGFINAHEWVNLLALVFRLDQEFIVKVYSDVVKREELFQGGREESESPSEVILDVSSVPKEETKPKNPKKKKKEPKIPKNSKPTESSLRNLLKQETDLKLLKQKKFAMIKMKQALPNKILLHKLWDIVSTEPFLIEAWANSAFPTGKLISCTKAISDIHSRGHVTHAQKSISPLMQNVLKKHERLLETYSSMNKRTAFC